MNNPTFNQWHVNCGGLCGYDPSNQATERAMEKYKGTKKFKGLMNIGHNMGSMIQVELPKFIVNVSTTCMGVESRTCLQEEAVVLNTDSSIYKELALYYNSIKDSVDTISVIGKNTEKKEYLINTEEFVGKFIDEDRVTTYYEALKGETRETYQTRHKFIECVSSLCLVTGIKMDNKVIYTGSCVRYCKTRYCNHAGYYQYKNKLKSYAVIIPTHRTPQARQYDRRSTPKNDLKDRYNSIAIKLDTLKTLIFRKASLYHSITQRISLVPSVTTIRNELDDKNNHYCSTRLDTATKCELLIINLNSRIRKWKGPNQEKEEIDTVLKHLQQVHACLRST